MEIIFVGKVHSQKYPMTDVRRLLSPVSSEEVQACNTVQRPKDDCARCT